MIRILHVDDEPNLLDVIAPLLEREDDRFEVVSESHVDDGLERLRTEDVDCVVSDYDMPDRDGLDFLRAVREDHPDLPFILFTGKGSEDIAAEAISVGATEYLQKQGGTDQYTVLANRIANAVEAHRAERRTELTHQALETANEGVSFVEADGSFSYVNPAFAELFGYEPAELHGVHWTVLYHEEEAERLEREILPAVEEMGYWSGETVRLTKDDERLVTDHRLAHTGTDVIVCTAQDVTAERKAEAGQDPAFDLLVDVMEDHAFYTLDHEGYVTRWNHGARRLTGYPADEILGEHLATFFTEDERREDRPNELIETARTDGSVRREGWRVRSDGSRFWAHATLSSSTDDNGVLRGFGELIQAAEPP